jgi:hypothetical protein
MFARIMGTNSLIKEADVSKSQNHNFSSASHNGTVCLHWAPILCDNFCWMFDINFGVDCREIESVVLVWRRAFGYWLGLGCGI